MKRIFIIVAAIAVIGLGGAITLTKFPAANAENETAQAQAGEQTATFTIEKMTCAACPITVRKAMERVDGVKSVKVDFEGKTATVLFDPSIATADQIGAASTEAGYPAKPAL